LSAVYEFLQYARVFVRLGLKILSLANTNLLWKFVNYGLKKLITLAPDQDYVYTVREAGRVARDLQGDQPGGSGLLRARVQLEHGRALSRVSVHRRPRQNFAGGRRLVSVRH
jgi:hypothetical protein